MRFPPLYVLRLYTLRVSSRSTLHAPALMPDPLPGKGVFGWLGRQFGHVKKAAQTDVTKPEPKVVYRENRVEEQPHPDQPGVKLRRTVIDEVIVDPATKQQAIIQDERYKADKEHDE